MWRFRKNGTAAKTIFNLFYATVCLEQHWVAAMFLDISGKHISGYGFHYCEMERRGNPPSYLPTRTVDRHSEDSKRQS